MIYYQIYFKVEGELYGFFYHFDNIPSKYDLNILIRNAVKEYLIDQGLNGIFSDLDISIYH